jgi:4-hydroxy-3-methylbut-2-enyl diphosphate reductase
VRLVRENGYRLQVGRLDFRLARSFGFCYGVDRAVEYAYEARRKFPERRIYLVGEIIHNPHVNRQLEEMGIEFLYPDDQGAFDFSPVRREHVVIIPAFGVTLGDFETLRALDCILVDTTCGSVLNVWKRVESYGREGFTAIIHGKYWHEETRATSSQIGKYAGGKYVIVRDMDETEKLCEYMAGRLDRETFLTLSTRMPTCCVWASPIRPRCWPRNHWPSRTGSSEQSRSGTARLSWGSGSAVSTPSARPPRTGRMPSWR